MIKGALFTIGILATIGGFGLAALMIAAAGMSDNVQAANETGSSALWVAGIGVAGIAMIIGAFFI